MHAKIVLLYENEAGKALCDTASRIIAEAAVSFGHTFTLPVRRCPAQDTVPDDVLAAYAAGLSSVRGQMADWGLDEGELLDVTDVTPDDIAALAEGR